MKQETKKYILSALIAANLAFIWGNSLMTGDASGDMSGSLLAKLAALLPFLATETAHAVLRKLAHFSEFALLGLLTGGRLRLSDRPIRLPIMGLGLFVACVDETIQYVVPGRASMLLDVWIDTAGFAAGVGILCLGICLYRHINLKKN